MTTIREALDLGFQQHHAGNLQAAEQIYRQILAADPRQDEAWHLLGAVSHQVGRYDVAIDAMERAVGLNPNIAWYRCNLGECYRTVGRHAEAEAQLRVALQLNPNSAESHTNLGVALQDMGRLDEARTHLENALRLNPNLGTTYNSLGNVLKEQGHAAQAEDCYRQCLRLLPENAMAHNNLGTVLQELGRPLEAEASLREALRLKPEMGEIYSNLGVLYKAEGRLDEAEACYRECLRRLPSMAMAHNNLGTVQQERGRFDEAVASFREAVRLQGTFNEASSNMLFCLGHSPTATREAVFAEHCAWGRGLEATCPRQPHGNDRRPDRRLRIGYVSGDFRAHAVFRFFEPILRHHDPAQVEVFCYSEVRSPDSVTAHMKSLAHHWRSTCGISNEKAVELVRGDQIDILVDLAGHTAYNRLPIFAYKPAPVQVTFLGYPNTTGLSTIDYRITDEIMDPPDEPTLMTETLVRLPRGVCCFAPLEDAPELSPPPVLQRGYITFGSMHRLSKINPQVIDVWCRVLDRVPSSRLLMLRDTLVGTRRDELFREFTRRGIAGERLDLRNSSGGDGHLSIFREIDISLDTFPYTGGTISCESLWMGVPLATIRGDRPSARGGADALHYAGLGRLIARNPDEYVFLIAGLAEDVDELVTLRSTLRQRLLSTLCDCAAYTRTLEAAYRQMWRTWCKQ